MAGFVGHYAMNFDANDVRAVMAGTAERRVVMAVLTSQTCGEPCWHAREDVCRCSCGGRNHGCLLNVGGKQPVRATKIDGQPHELLAVGNYRDMDNEAVRLNTEAGIKFRYAHTARENFGENPPIKMRKATQAQVAKWAELTAYRAPESLITLGEPYLLWKTTQ